MQILLPLNRVTPALSTCFLSICQAKPMIDLVLAVALYLLYRHESAFFHLSLSKKANKHISQNSE